MDQGATLQAACTERMYLSIENIDYVAHLNCQLVYNLPTVLGWLSKGLSTQRRCCMLSLPLPLSQSLLVCIRFSLCLPPFVICSACAL